MRGLSPLNGFGKCRPAIIVTLTWFMELAGPFQALGFRTKYAVALATAYRGRQPRTAYRGRIGEWVWKMPTRDHCHIDVVHGTCWAIPSARIQDEVRGRIGAVRRQRAPQSRNVGGVSLVFGQPVVKHCSSQRARAGRDDRSLAPVTWVTA